MLGELSQRVQAVGDRGAGGFVPRRDEQDEEGRELLAGQLFAFNFRVHERAGDVINRVFDAVLAEILHDGGQGGARLQEGHDGVSADGNDVRVAHGQDDVGAGEHRGVFARRHAHHVADDLQGERCRNVGHEVAGAGFLGARHRLGGHSLNGVFDGPHVAGIEGVGHDATKSRVFGVIRGDHAGEVLDHLFGQVHGGHRAGPREENVGVARRVSYISVRGQGPITVRRREFHCGADDLGVGELSDG